MLRDECDRSPELGAPARRRHFQQVLTREQQRPSRDLESRGRKKLGERPSNHGFSGTGLTDQTRKIVARFERSNDSLRIAGTTAPAIRALTTRSLACKTNTA